jgi:O-acetyl-ADP-ribose deacetylase (regulator of RNase III)
MELKSRWNGCAISLHQGDITTLAIDAIVNAANPWLMGGGGVDGAIHRRGGPKIMQECQQIMAVRKTVLPAGKAVLTTGGDLPARYVIHTVGPVFREEGREQAEVLLAACYRNSLAVLREQGARRIAFPCISTGAYGYPSVEACPVALRAVREELERHGACDEVTFCTFDEDDYRIYEEAFKRMGEAPG